MPGKIMPEYWPELDPLEEQRLAKKLYEDSQVEAKIDKHRSREPGREKKVAGFIKEIKGIVDRARINLKIGLELKKDGRLAISTSEKIVPRQSFELDKYNGEIRAVLRQAGLNELPDEALGTITYLN